MVPLGDEAQVQPRFGLLDIVLILTQDRCTVLRRTYQKLKNCWDAPMELLGDVGHVEPHFSPCGDSVNVGARLVHGLR